MVLREVLQASTWDEVLQITKVENTRHGYRKLLRQVHPDMNSDPLAAEVSAHLNSLWGKRGSNRKHPSPQGSVLRDVGGVVLIQTTDGKLMNSMQYPDDSDLYQNYVEALRVFDGLPPFFPRFVMRHRDPNLPKVAAEVQLEPGTWLLLSDFEKLHTRDVVWIGKRVFTALLLAHKEGRVHGNIHDAIVWVLPDEHGVTVDGWWGSTKLGESLLVRPVHMDALQGKAPIATEEFDVRAASLTLLKHVDGSGPVKDMLKKLAVEGGSAQKALDNLNFAAEEEFGAPAFHVMTTRSASRPDGIRVQKA